MEGEEAEEAQGGRGNKAADLGGIDRVEIEIFNIRANQSVLPKGLVQARFQMAGVEAGKVYKMKVEAGLGSSGDDEKWNEGQRDRAIPKKATDHEYEEEVETVEELLVVGVLHLPHPSELLHPKSDLFFCFRHQGIMPSQKGKNNLVTFPDESFGRKYLHGAIEKFPRFPSSRNDRAGASLGFSFGLWVGASVGFGRAGAGTIAGPIGSLNLSASFKTSGLSGGACDSCFVAGYLFEWIGKSKDRFTGFRKGFRRIVAVGRRCVLDQGTDFPTFEPDIFLG